ncbi:MAG: class I SAM-dependent methyltransferase [Calothrix sp. MO_167.B42]|nr:class I SAM-dependent methyltransferase [Calothrix sp. MO_167.B42]
MVIQKQLPEDFDSKVYLELNPDVAEAGMNARFHYLNYGIEEDRKYKEESFSKKEKISKCWANHVDRQKSRTSWLHSPIIINHVNRLVSGDEKNNWLAFFLKKYFSKKRWGGRGLILGCNHGEFDRQLIKARILSKIDAYDISEESIELAKKAALKEKLNINYEIADINELELPEEYYDLVLVTHSVHHFEKLEEIFTRINNSLKKDGFFVFDEYIGPKRFQWTEQQLKIINTLREQLPSELRLLTNGLLAGPVEQTNIEALIKEDPSEAIRSDEIVNLTYEHFQVVEYLNYGGTILHMFFHEIIRNFDESNSTHVGLIKMLCTIEEILIEQNILSSDFAVMICKKLLSSGEEDEVFAVTNHPDFI